MEWLRILASRFLGFFRRRELECDLDTELRAHIEALTEENIRRGARGGYQAGRLQESR